MMLCGRLLDASTPWTDQQTAGQRVVYLAANSPNILDKIESGCTYVIGGLVDHKAKPGVSYDRATAHNVETARLPLDDAIDLRAGLAGGMGSSSFSTPIIVANPCTIITIHLFITMHGGLIYIIAAHADQSLCPQEISQHWLWCS